MGLVVWVTLITKCFCESRIINEGSNVYVQRGVRCLATQLAQFPSHRDIEALPRGKYVCPSCKR